MTSHHYPALNDEAITETRNALHAYAGILGNCLKQCRDKRKHWLHASLRPSLNGLTTGVVHAEIDFEIELNIRESLIQINTSTGKHLSEKLHGQSALDLAEMVKIFCLQMVLTNKSVLIVQRFILVTQNNKHYLSPKYYIQYLAR